MIECTSLGGVGRVRCARGALIVRVIVVHGGVVGVARARATHVVVRGLLSGWWRQVA